MEKAITYLKPLYKKEAPRILQTLETYAKTLPHVKPKSDKTYWYKLLDLYVVYPDGVIHDPKSSPLENLRSHMLYVKTLGCNAVHILPFLESPLRDRGFDVSDYYAIRKDLGTLDDLKNIIDEAEKANIRLFMDLIFNHVSEKHIWFQKAQSGEKKYRDFFITTKKKPNFLGLVHKENAVWAKYLVNGKEIDVNIAFPEFTGEIPHFRKSEDGYWYYHTYFPQELDLNWENPEVFIEAAKVMLYWASFGFSFRLDAIPFVGKSAYKIIDDGEENVFLITAALKTIAETIHPQSAFLVETYEKLDRVINYFGNANRIQANLSYNFHLCTNIWVSLVTENPEHIWKNLEQEKNIPKHADWVNFLRNHDELSLAYLTPELTHAVNQALLKHGEPFRENYGIAGRTFSFIGYQDKRFLMAYFLLASLPGGIAIPYGDEIAYRNTPLYKMQELERLDPRNINRGTITSDDFHKPHAKRISNKMCTILTQRKTLQEYLHVWPQMIPAPKGIFGALYKLGSSELHVYINLSKKRIDLKKKLKGYSVIAGINAFKFKDEILSLGPYAGVWLQK